MRTKRIIRILKWCVFAAVGLIGILSVLVKPKQIRDAEDQIEGWERGVLPSWTSNLYPVRRLPDGRVAFSMYGYVPFGEDASFPFAQPGKRSFFGVPKKHQYLGYRTDSIGIITGGKISYHRVYSPVYRFWLELVDEKGKKIEFAPQIYKTDVTLVNMHPWTFFPSEARFEVITTFSQLRLLLSMLITRFGFFKYLVIAGIVFIAGDWFIARRIRKKTDGTRTGQQTGACDGVPAAHDP